MRIQIIGKTTTLNTRNKTNKTSLTNTNKIVQSRIFSENYRPLSFKSLREYKYQKAKKYLNEQKNILKETTANESINIDNFDLKKLEGIQKGIKVFDGLTMKEIAFIASTTQEFALTRGCSNQCAHCYVDAKPHLHLKKDEKKYINAMSWEDFESLTKGIATLNNRLGVHITKPKSDKTNYIAPFHDADCMEIVLKDKYGEEHDLTEIIPMLYYSTGKQVLFDTSGWNPKDKRIQQRAQKYVKFFSKPENMQYIHFFNVSLNPFHALNAKSVELKNTDENRAKKFKELYTERMANVFYTFTPLIDKKKFDIIARCATKSAATNNEFKEKNFRILIAEIENKLKQKYEQDLEHKPSFIQTLLQTPKSQNPRMIKTKSQMQKIIKEIERKTNYLDSGILALGRMQKLLDKEDNSLKIVKFRQEHSLAARKLNLKNNIYTATIDANGKVYLTDEYTILPTALQLNFENKNKKTTPMESGMQNVVLTRKMIKKTRD